MGSFIWIFLSIVFGLIYSFINTLPVLSATVLVDILWFLFLLSIGITSARFLSYALTDILIFRIQGKSSSDLLRFIISFVLYTGIFTLMFKYVLGWNLTAILTTSALLTAIVGFALQATLGNLFAGVALQIEQAFYIGDVIRIGGRLGRIEALRWRSIIIRTFDGSSLVIPNNQISTETVEVYPAKKSVRITAIVPVPLNISPEKISNLIVKIIISVPNVDTTIKPLIRIYEYDTARGIINYQIRYFVVNYVKKHIVDGVVKDRIWHAFQRHNIQLPQMTFLSTDDPESSIHIENQGKNMLTQEAIADSIATIEKYSANSRQSIEKMAQHVKIYTYGTGEPILYTEPKVSAIYYIYQGIVKIKQAASMNEHTTYTPDEQNLSEHWPTDLLKKVHQELTMFMGPISEQLVKQAANQTLDTRQLYLLLAENISKTKDQNTFLSFAPDYSFKIFLTCSWFHTSDISETEAFAQGETILIEVPDAT